MPECEHCGIDLIEVKEWMGMMLCEKCYYLFDEEETWEMDGWQDSGGVWHQNKILSSSSTVKEDKE